ncbi:MAG: TIGR01906 family membrane protein [Lachnospiraceae bacterium]|nr:TIGR01906 family membrane protein [Lachnospiraceae bacterium]
MLVSIRKYTAAFFMLLGLTALFLVLIINSRFFYQLLLEPLHIPETSGFSREEILLNYNCLIDYCSPLCRDALEFPTFCSSASALSHFAEVKTLFTALYLLAPAGLLTSLYLITRLPRRERPRALGTAGRVCLVLPALLLCLCALSFHELFFDMHRLLFRNNDWLFDAVSDPVIRILPESFFLACAKALLLLLILAGVLLVALEDLSALRLRARLRSLRTRPRRTQSARP